MSPSAGASQNWVQLRLLISRSKSSGSGVVSLVLRTQNGTERLDRRLDIAVVDLPEDDPAWSDPLEAALRAVEALQARRAQR